MSAFWRRSAIPLLLVAVLFAFACGGDDDDDATIIIGDDDNDSGDGNDDDDSGGDDDDSGNDDDDDNDAGDDDDDDGEENVWGMVYLQEGVSSTGIVDAPVYSSYASAAFYDPDEIEGWAEDPDETDGACERYHYDGTSQPGTAVYRNAGAVTVTGANVSPIHLTAHAYQYGYYYQPDYDYVNEDNLFDGGDTISASCAGQGEIPGFSGSVNAPGAANVTAPAGFDSLTGLPSGAIAVSWSAGGADEVTVTVSTTLANSHSQTILCTAPDSDGGLTVPASLTEDLYDNPYTWSLSVSRRAETRVEADGKEILVQASTFRTRTVVDTD